jgi:hypothetical protein
MRVVRRDESRVIDSVKEIDVDTVPPRRARVGEAVRDRDGLPGDTPSVTLRYRGRENRRPIVRVFRTDDGRRTSSGASAAPGPDGHRGTVA